MKKSWIVGFLIISIISLKGYSQEKLDQLVFDKQPINYGGEVGQDPAVENFQKGRLVIKKITVPEFLKGSDVHLKLSLKSAGDRWDKSGSCFVVADSSMISLIDVARGTKEFPLNSNVQDKYLGIKKTDTYEPLLELLRFVTPFGVGHFSSKENQHRKPVYIPKWEKKVVWEEDISHLLQTVNNTFYIGVWIDTWTKEGYLIDLSLHYSNRPDHIRKVKTIFNTVNYLGKQSLPAFFAESDLEQLIKFNKPVKNVKLHYITTGHGGHSGGDEFKKCLNRLWIDQKKILEFVPWRDDCASYRRFNPTSGVWLKKDSASYIDFKEKQYKVKEIEERIASSDLSRSNWCPGSKVEPVVVELGDMEAGEHEIKIEINASKAEKAKFNHWLVSAYLTYEE